jgi:hypothetical protein
MSVVELWANLVQAHAALDWAALLPFYGILATAGLFGALMIRLVRQAAAGRKAADRIQTLERELKQLRGLEEQTRQLRSDTGALQAQLDKGYESLRERVENQKDAVRTDIEELERGIRQDLEEVERTVRRKFEDATTRAVRRMEKLEQDGEEVLRQMESNNHRIASVEKRIPDIYEHLEDFRATLGRIFENELSAVLDSFDSSVTAVLDHMKGELEMGINRIEGIENMVHSRQRAERTLFGRGSYRDQEEDSDEQQALPGGLAEESELESEMQEEVQEMADAPIEEDPFEIQLETEAEEDDKAQQIPDPPVEDEAETVMEDDGGSDEPVEEQESVVAEPIDGLAEDEVVGDDDDEDFSAAA